MNVSPVMQYQHYNGDLVSLSIKAVEKMLIFVLMEKHILPIFVYHCSCLAS